MKGLRHLRQRRRDDRPIKVLHEKCPGDKQGDR
jgi:hypothetical protein